MNSLAVLTFLVYNGVLVRIKQKRGLIILIFMNIFLKKQGPRAKTRFGHSMLPYHPIALNSFGDSGDYAGHFDTHESYIGWKTLGRFFLIVQETV